MTLTATSMLPLVALEYGHISWALCASVSHFLSLTRHDDVEAGLDEIGAAGLAHIHFNLHG